MILEDRKKFYGGLGMMMLFFAVMILMFSPVFKGQNGLEYLDSFYNSISKGSAYYIPKIKEEADTFVGKPVTATFTMSDGNQAKQTAPLFMKGGAAVNISDSTLHVSGDLGRIMLNCLADADMMYMNDGGKIFQKYGYDEKRVLFNWWAAFKAMDKELKQKKKFKEAKMLGVVVKKAVESSYNYYKIEAQRIGDAAITVIFSLVFYVVYTVWYGFAIMFMFEGWGMRLGH